LYKYEALLVICVGQTSVADSCQINFVIKQRSLPSLLLALFCNHVPQPIEHSVSACQICLCQLNLSLVWHLIWHHRQLSSIYWVCWNIISYLGFRFTTAYN